jgi:putative glycosyltransferase (TIGR04348 family)
MHLAIVTPASAGTLTGNRVTAMRWASILRQTACTVAVGCDIAEFGDLRRIDGLIALHARRSAPSIEAFHQQCPDRPLIVCLTGTDLHLDYMKPDSAERGLVQRSLDIATQIILLEPASARLLEPAFRAKAHVIFQSAERLKPMPAKPANCFSVVVIGHLRDVKDPFRAEAASRLLPPSSTIRLTQTGSADLQPELGNEALRLQASNQRYRWCGPRTHEEAIRALAASHLLVLSSRLEGAPNVISEAVVHDVPVLASRIDATVGLLGADYPGLFDVGDTGALARLMERAECEPAFYQELLDNSARIRWRFLPQTEKAEWKKLLDAAIASRRR